MPKVLTRRWERADGTSEGTGYNPAVSSEIETPSLGYDLDVS